MASTAPVYFTAEEIARYQVRLEEGYDLPDQRYEQWVQMYHPGSIENHLDVQISNGHQRTVIGTGKTTVESEAGKGIHVHHRLSVN